MKKTRDIQLDFVRVVATFFVMSVHFFLKTGFYKQQIIGWESFVQILFRSLFMTCVPLFIILSGYLLNYRNINIKHFLSIRKVLFQYFLCTILLFLFDVMKGWRVASFRSFVDNLVSFGQYSWYIKKYVLLFIMIPFINTFFRKVKNKKTCQISLLVLAMIILIPTTFELAGVGGQRVCDTLLKISDKLYTVLYYSIGVYYYYYKDEFIVLKSKILLMSLIGTLLTTSAVAYLRYVNNTYLWENWNSYNGIFVFLSATTLFLLLLRVDLSGIKNGVVGKMIEKFSKISIYIYLLSYIFDNIYYEIFEKIDIPVFTTIKYPLIPVLVFVSAYFMGELVNLIFENVDNKFEMIIYKKGKV